MHSSLVTANSLLCYSSFRSCCRLTSPCFCGNVSNDVNRLVIKLRNECRASPITLFSHSLIVVATICDNNDLFPLVIEWDLKESIFTGENSSGTDGKQMKASQD